MAVATLDLTCLVASVSAPLIYAMAAAGGQEESAAQAMAAATAALAAAIRVDAIATALARAATQAAVALLLRAPSPTRPETPELDELLQQEQDEPQQAREADCHRDLLGRPKALPPLPSSRPFASLAAAGTNARAGASERITFLSLAEALLNLLQHHVERVQASDALRSRASEAGTCWGRAGGLRGRWGRGVDAQLCTFAHADAELDASLLMLGDGLGCGRAPPAAEAQPTDLAALLLSQSDFKTMVVRARVSRR
jgi:hypothetical protein